MSSEHSCTVTEMKNEWSDIKLETKAKLSMTDMKGSQGSYTDTITAHFRSLFSQYQFFSSLQEVSIVCLVQMLTSKNPDLFEFFGLSKNLSSSPSTKKTNP